MKADSFETFMQPNGGHYVGAFNPQVTLISDPGSQHFHSTHDPAHSMLYGVHPMSPTPLSGYDQRQMSLGSDGVSEFDASYGLANPVTADSLAGATSMNAITNHQAPPMGLYGTGVPMTHCNRYGSPGQQYTPRQQSSMLPSKYYTVINHERVLFDIWATNYLPC